MNISEYRRKIEEQLAAEGQQDLLSDAVMGAAGGSSIGGGDLDASDPQQVLAAVNDTDRPLEQRIALLHNAGSMHTRQGEFLEQVVDILGDEGQDSGLRLAALSLLEQSAFHSPAYSSVRPRFLETLRQVVETDDEALRLAATERLALEGDEFIQRRLVEGLEDPQRALAPAAQAIHFLGYDMHAQIYPLLREIVSDPPSAEARQEALRLLGADPGSRDILSDIYTGKGEAQEARVTSGLALKALDPQDFARHAMPIILDESEEDEVRAASLNAMTYIPAQDDLLADALGGSADSGDSFEDAVARLADEAQEGALKKVAQRYLAQTGRSG